MSKQQCKSLSEQLNNKGFGAAPFHREEIYQTRGSIMSGNSQMKENGDGSDIQTLAFQIYQEKGGSDLDNWLEAERILKNDAQAVSNFINEGDPNI